MRPHPGLGELYIVTCHDPYGGLILVLKDLSLQ